MYAGAFGYADDVVLLAPSLNALKEMVSICETYATEYQLLFKKSKSKLMYFNISHENFSVKLSGKEMLLVSHETFLGTFMVVIYLIGQSLNLSVLLIKGVTI